MDEPNKLARGRMFALSAALFAVTTSTTSGCSSTSTSNPGGNGGGSAGNELQAIENGPSLTAASTSWVYGTTLLLGFYADGTGVSVPYSSPEPTCPGVCRSPLSLCGRYQCTNLTSDSSNCGACGTTCAASQYCNAGTCIPTPTGGGGVSDAPTQCYYNFNPVPCPRAVPFTWTQLSDDSILFGAAEGFPGASGAPFENLTSIQGSISAGNFSAVANGKSTVSFTLTSGPPCALQ